MTRVEDFDIVSSGGAKPDMVLARLRHVCAEREAELDAAQTRLDGIRSALTRIGDQLRDAQSQLAAVQAGVQRAGRLQGQAAVIAASQSQIERLRCQQATAEHAVAAASQSRLAAEQKKAAWERLLANRHAMAQRARTVEQQREWSELLVAHGGTGKMMPESKSERE